jgi:hypothetical protein
MIPNNEFDWNYDRSYLISSEISGSIQSESYLYEGCLSESYTDENVDDKD